MGGWLLTSAKGRERRSEGRPRRQFGSPASGTAHDETLEVEFGGDAQRERHAERIMVRLERLRLGAAAAVRGRHEGRQCVWAVLAKSAKSAVGCGSRAAGCGLCTVGHRLQSQAVGSAPQAVRRAAVG
eukprot:180653-Prymnesium_polylepis.1